MKKILMTSAILACLSVTALAVTGTVQNITAQIRGDITVKVDGITQTFYTANGDMVEPISYEGTTYLPVRAIGELMDKEVLWDANTKTIDLVKQGTVGEDITDFDKDVTTTPTTTSPQVVQIPDLENTKKEIDDLELKISNATTINLEQYRMYDAEIDTLDNALDILDDKYEYNYEQKQITLSEYNEIENDIEFYEDILDRLEDVLENKSGIDD